MQAPADVVTAYETALPDNPDIARKRMFGTPCAFVRRQMFFGTFGETLIATDIGTIDFIGNGSTANISSTFGGDVEAYANASPGLSATSTQRIGPPHFSHASRSAPQTCLTAQAQRLAARLGSWSSSSAAAVARTARTRTLCWEPLRRRHGGLCERRSSLGGHPQKHPTVGLLSSRRGVNIEAATDVAQYNDKCIL